jgi:hypothetical protein
MFLVATGLLLIPGRRSDRDAWWWRGSVGAAGVGWALLWAPSFVLQARGGHSSWIPHTTPVTLVNAIAHLVTSVPTLALATVSAIAAGGLVIVRRRGPLGKLWIAGFLVPIAVAAVAGLVEPVVLDRTFTLIAWAPMVAVAVALDALMRRSIAAGAIVAIAATAVILPAAFDQTQIMTGSNGALRALERRVRPGDIVAVQPASKAPELQWSLGVRRRSRITPVPMPGVPNSFAIHYGHDAESSGRLLILDLRKRHTETGLVASRCDSSSSSLHPHISCLAFARPHEHIPDA